MKKILIILFAIIATNVFAHDKYLSFTDGYVGKTDFKVTKTIKESSSYIDVTYNFEGAYIDIVKEDGTTYHTITMPDAYNSHIKGEPELPNYIDNLIVNSSSNISLSIVKTSYKDYSNINLLPSLGDFVIGTQPDKRSKGSIYNKNSFYPSKSSELTNVRSYNSIPLATTSVKPVSYNPVTKKLRCYSSITYRIKQTSNLEKPNTKISKNKIEFLKGMVINPKAVSKYQSNTLKSTTISQSTPENAEEILIISPDVFKPAVEKFVKWKSMQGFNCVVKYGEGQWWNRKRLKNTLKEYYKDHIPDYILIVGDHISGVDEYSISNYSSDVQDFVRKYTVEGEWVTFHVNNENYNFPTDIPFACINYINNWNNIDMWKQLQDVYTPDIAIGRISVTSLEEANIVFDKILRYEQTPPIDKDFYDRVLHCANYQNVNRDKRLIYYDFLKSTENSEILYKFMSTEQAKNVTRIYTANVRNEADHLTLSHWTDPYRGGGWDYIITDNSETQLIQNEINKGYSYLLYGGHGSTDHWSLPYYHNDNAKQLNNGDKLSVYFGSNTCHTGEYWKNKENRQDSTCLTETFLRNKNGGAVAAFANASVGWNPTSFDATDRLIRKIYSGKENTLTKAMLSSWYTNSSYITERFIAMSCHYFGDPTMAMYTYNPTCFSPTITTSGTTVKVDAGVEDCKITLTSMVDPSDVSKMKIEEGQKVTFSNINYPFYITIQKYNYVPYIGSGDTYIQNTTLTNDITILGTNIFCGQNVLPNNVTGVVKVTGNNVRLKSDNSIKLRDGFSVKSGSTFKAYIDPHDCLYSGIGEESSTLKNSNITYEFIDNDESALREEMFQVYPNPTTGLLNVDVSEQTVNIRVIDLYGRQIRNFENVKGSIEIDLTDERAGIYAVTIDNDTYHLTYKVVLK